MSPGRNEKFPTPVTTREMGTSSRRNDFWDHLGRNCLFYDWLMVASNTIDQSELQLTDPTNHCTKACTHSPWSF